jgi:hypothetical protein
LVLFLTTGATLDLWSKRPEETRVQSAYVIHVPQPVPEPPQFDPGAETAREYRRRVEQYVEDAAQSWVEASQAAGWVMRPVRRRRRRDSDDALQHFRWLALYQAGGLSPSRIAARYGKERNSVWAAITSLAGLMALPLRKQRRGRPSGSESSSLAANG